MTTAEERMRILNLIEEGRVSPDEGATLLGALGDRAPAIEPRPLDPGSGRRLRLVVTDTYSGNSRVSIAIPLGLVKMALKIGARFVPDTAAVDVDEIREAIESGLSGKILEVNDDEDGERVEIFVD